MAVSAAMVKELRERTGLGMMECKRALEETNGDIEVAIDNLRKSGQAKAAKKAGRIAAEGAVLAKVSADGKKGVLVEVNSETDFVARDESFRNFAEEVVTAALASGLTDVVALGQEKISTGVGIEEARLALVQKIGENVQVRRAASIEGGSVVGAYVHSGRIGVLVALKGGDAELAKDIAMHVAASNPLVVRGADVSEATLAKEREIYTAQAAESGKPADIVAKMVEGRVAKFLKEVSLVDQPFVKDPDITVGALAKKAGAEIEKFLRFDVGEGIEKAETDFAAEVMAQVRGNQ
ncbi:Elongation factor Ts [gamma proteobacterium HdN1]|nr:Elongation factor Ts [gamma proteobacterium HdN1]